MHIVLALFSLSAVASALCPVIKPGTPWFDTDNKTLQAHGGGILEADGMYYLIGENKTRSERNPRGNRFNSVACYSSRDLVSWEFRNDLLSYNTSIPDLGDDRIIERPKVIFNKKTNKYVMWMHVDSANYGDARSGVAISDTPCGDYQYLGSQRPLGHIARDMTLFVDDDQTAYLVAEDRKEGTHFFQLSEDYLSIGLIKGTIPFSFMPALEAPAVIKVEGIYFFPGSKLSGWSPNDNQYTSAASLAGPWNKAALFAPAKSNTCTSQTTFVLPGKNGNFLYMGDRWFQNTLDESQYIWEPLVINAKNRTARMDCRKSWRLKEIGL